MVERKSEAAQRESLHHRSERRAIYVIMDAVFGLSLGLGAFSLTELPIANAQDLFASIAFFGFSYFVIFMSWMVIRRHFEDGYTVYGSVNMILFLTGFFIAIMPIPIRIILMQALQPSSFEVIEAAFKLYSLRLCNVTLTMGTLSFAYAKQSWRVAPWRDFMHLLDEGVGAFVMGFVFLLSAFLPFGNTLGDTLSPSILSFLPSIFANFPSNIGFWVLGALIMALPAAIITRIALWLKRPKE